MKVINENLNLRNFDAWSGAKETKETIIENGKQTEFENLIDEIYPEGLTDTQLNDLLWFDDDWLFQNLGIEAE